MSINIVYPDAHTLNPGDLDWMPLQKLGHLQAYEHTPADQVVERLKEADIVLVNKVKINAEILDQLPRLRCICVTATGYNNVDTEAARERDIPVCNAVGYSTPAVAQHVFALLLEMTNRVGAHARSVRAGDWSGQPHFAYWLETLDELYGKTMGIYGFGRIGQAVAKIAMAFGMQVRATHKHPIRDAMEGVHFVPLEQLFRESDVISLNAPLTEDNFEIVNAELLGQMQATAYLINTGRGGLINETDLHAALSAKRLKGAALDVLQNEPPREGHPLLALDNCWITPHQAWASYAARQRLLDIVVENVKAFLDGQPTNVVNA
ncbi:MAG TPA: D-2-hydroxyacid dehydrogenase [Saprospiraceae bacterium]|nr:D-2-hydroxyacid dehydrogenase [Saprospiraceae bacterium]